MTDHYDAMQTARLISIEIKDRAKKTEEQVIQKLVQHYRSGQLDEKVLLGGIAEISLLRQIVYELERDVNNKLKEFETDGK